ncbi:hypothetical protein [Streptomyces sp. YS415]|uniref:hypothetical protein n=1 Tax=Streptomyces sp. YS415 TaxID=2944806 RepID=UPI002021268A|nr:hypothetical protein [Streptomyces sp. YS415]MCL7428956.1 hypothetical protein [Streptomyces sp. YS415]
MWNAESAVATAAGVVTVGPDMTRATPPASLKAFARSRASPAVRQRPRSKRSWCTNKPMMEGTGILHSEFFTAFSSRSAFTAAAEHSKEPYASTKFSRLRSCRVHVGFLL